MALSSTIFKALLDLSDLNRNHFQTYKLTLARHPSEQNQRMMLRLIAFAMFANDDLMFTKGLSTKDEPDLWQKSASGEIMLWIELGLPDERRIRQAFSLSKQVVIFAYGDKHLTSWQQQIDSTISRFPKLKIFHVSDEQLIELAGLAEKNMHLHCSIQENDIYIGNDSVQVQIELNQIQ